MNEISVASSDDAPIVTVIQVVSVDAENEDRTLERVVGEMRDVAGGASNPASSHAERTTDGTHLVYCAQWRSRGALELALGVTGAKARRDRIQRMAEDDPHLYEWATFAFDYESLLGPSK